MRILANGVSNEAGIKNAVKGRFCGKEYTFTHRNPKTGEVWCDDYPVSNNEVGAWVPNDQVEFA